jgi:hypothetical protein
MRPLKIAKLRIVSVITLVKFGLSICRRKNSTRADAPWPLEGCGFSHGQCDANLPLAVWTPVLGLEALPPGAGQALANHDNASRARLAAGPPACGTAGGHQAGPNLPGGHQAGPNLRGETTDHLGSPDFTKCQSPVQQLWNSVNPAPRAGFSHASSTPGAGFGGRHWLCGRHT